MHHAIPILFEDTHFLIVDKPSGLLTTPGRGPDKQDCLITRIQIDYPHARIVHRLDMATSGIIILALSHKAQAAMGKLFEQRCVEKEYLAIVDGKLDQANGEIDLPLICDWDNRPRQKVCFENGKPAQTLFTLLEYDEQHDCSRVQLQPLTGRSHQLRVHMLALGHAIVGDYFYAAESVLAKSKRLLLHAQRISFIHPMTKQPLDIYSPVPF